MSKWNYEPEWIPQDPTGEDWRFVSYKGRHLGRVLRVDTDAGAVYLSEKFCCHSVHEHLYMDAAARRVLTVLRCTECKLSCLLVSN